MVKYATKYLRRGTAVVKYSPERILQIEAKVQQLLEECHTLKSQRDKFTTQGDHKHAGSLQNEIIRKLALIEWLCLQSFTIALEQDNQSSTTQQIRILAGSAKELEEQVKAFTLPEIFSGENEKERHFPWYLQLPGPVVREKILGYLTSPEDKLNVLKAIPEETILMKSTWNVTNLQLSMVLPIVFRTCRNILDWKEIFALSMLDRYWRNFIQKDYENYLLDKPETLWRFLWERRIIFPSELTREEDEFWRPNDSKGCHLNPLPGLVPLISLEIDGRDSHGYKRALRQWGHRVWAVSIVVGIYSPVRLFENLAEWFSLLPNLRKLGLLFREKDVDVDTRSSHSMRILEAIVLPPLPELQVFQINISEAPEIGGVILKKILESLPLQGIRHLAMAANFSRLRSIDSSKIRLPRLERLRIDAIPRGSPIGDTIRYFKLFSGIPLKTISADVSLVNTKGQEELPRFLAVLNTLFGSTLEQLLVSVSYRDFAIDHEDLAPVPVTWLTDWTFPHLKNFSITGYFGFRGPSWAFLLQFPVLQNLSFDGVWSDFCDFFCEREQQIVQLSWDPRTMYSSNIWGLFPHLETIHFVRRTPSPREHEHANDDGETFYTIQRQRTVVYSLTRNQYKNLKNPQ